MADNNDIIPANVLSQAGPTEVESSTPVDLPDIETQRQAATPAPLNEPEVDIDLENNEIQKRSQSNINISSELSSEDDTERTVRATQIAEKRKLPVSFVRDNLDSFEKQETKQKYSQVKRKAPGLSRWVEDPENGKLVKRDIEFLSDAEESYKNNYFTDFSKAVGVGTDQLTQAVTFLAPNLSPSEKASIISDLAIKRRDFEANKPTYQKEFDKLLEEEIGDIQDASQRAINGFREIKDGMILEGLKNAAVGGVTTVAQVFDLISETLIQEPRETSLKIAESLANSAPSLALGASTAAAGGVIGSSVPILGTAAGAVSGAALGTFSGSAIVETGAFAVGELEKRGIDITDPSQIENALKDQNLVSSIKAKARRKGLTTAAIDTAFFLVGGQIAKVGATTTRGQAGRLAAGLASESAGEGIGEAAGQFAAEGDLAQVNFGEAAFEAVAGLGQSSFQTVLNQSIASGSAVKNKALAKLAKKNAVREAIKAKKETDMAIKAEEGARKLQDLTDKLSNLKDLNRTPEKLRDLVDLMAAENGQPQSIFFQTDDFDNFWQDKGASPAEVFSRLVKEGDEKYAEAKANGQPLEIGFGEYVANFGINKDSVGLHELARITADGMNLVEANEHMQGLPEKMSAIASAALSKEKTASEVFESEIKGIGKDIKNQLKQAGFTDKVSRQQALVYEERFRARAAILDMSPKELFEQRKLRIQKSEEFKGLKKDEKAKKLGQIIFSGGETIINLSKIKNPTTFLHETGHLFLEETRSDFETVQAIKPKKRTKRQQQFLEDSKEVLDFLEVSSFDQIDVSHHEKFAEGFETFLAEGKTSNSKLVRAFRSFKAWFLSVYKSATNMRTQLTPEVRRFYDSLFTGQQQISEASEDIDFLYDDLRLQGFSKELADQYIDARREALAQASDRLAGEVAKSERKKRQKIFKEREKEIKARVSEEVEALPVFRLINDIKEQQRYNAKIDFSAIKDSQFSSQIPKSLTQIKDGIDPNLLVEPYGYGSLEELLEDLASNHNRKDAIVSERVESEMKEVYREEGSILNDDAIENAALQSLHSDNMMDLIRLEAQMLFEIAPNLEKEIIRRQAAQMPDNKFVRFQARKTIAKLNVSNIRPRVFLNLSKKASRDAARALSDRRLTDVIKFKSSEQFNTALFQEASKAKLELKKVNALNKKLNKPDKQLSNTRDIDLVNASRALLAKFGLGPKGKDLDSILEKTKAYDAKVFETITGIIGSIAEGKNERNLTFDDVTEIITAAEALFDLAKESNQVDVEGRKASYQEAKDRIVAQLEFSKSRISKSDMNKLREISNKDKGFLHSLMSFKASTQRMFFWTRLADAGDFANGAVRTYIQQPLLNAVDNYRTNNNIAQQKWAEDLKKFKDALDGGPIEAPELGVKFNTMGELLGTLMHIGNQSNFQKLLRSEQWGSFDENGNLDTSRFDAFMNRLFEEGVLKKVHFDFLQEAVWNTFESHKGNTQKAFKSIYGFFFKEIPARTIKTPFGTYKGGYVPAKTDPRGSLKGAVLDNLQSIEDQVPISQLPGVDLGSTKERSEAFAAPLLKDLNVVPMHIDWMMRFTYIQPSSSKVVGLFRDESFVEKINEYDEFAVKEVILPWIDRITKQKTTTPVVGSGLWRQTNKIARVMRKRASQTLMFLNVKNVIEQATGLFLSANAVGTKNLRRAYANYFFSPDEFFKVAETSDFMRNRIEKDIFQIRDEIDRLRVDLERGFLKKATDFADRNAFILQKTFQDHIDLITWNAAYLNASENQKFTSEKQRIEFADQTVRETQGGFDPEFLSSAEVGTALAQGFIQFFSYFNNLWNLNETEAKLIYREYGVNSKAGARALFGQYMMGWFMVTVGASAIQRALSGEGFDEDDDGQYLDGMISMAVTGQIDAATASVPIVGPFIQSGINRFDDKIFNDDVSLSPVIGLGEQAIGAPFSAVKALTTGKQKSKAVRDAMTFINILTGVPVGPVARPAAYLLDVYDGKADPDGPIDFTRGLITGRKGK